MCAGSIRPPEICVHGTFHVTDFFLLRRGPGCLESLLRGNDAYEYKNYNAGFVVAISVRPVLFQVK